MDEGKPSRLQKVKTTLAAVPGGECYGRINRVYGSVCQTECVGEIPRMCVNATLRYWKYIPESESQAQENHNEGTVY